MKKLASLVVLLFATINPTTNLLAQKPSSRYKEFKEMKLNYIIDNTEMSKEEEEHFQCVFGNYEDKYHTSVWIKERKIKKQIQNSLDTISSVSASSYINEYYKLEKLGITLRNDRNQKLLEKIRTKQVLSILHQEQLFDKEMFKRIQERKNKKKKEEEKKR
ncbi:MAG: hypothetical protein P8I42_03240 [Flavobacteriaceae bacterium]|jgi:uncharacterized protein YdiU (UPF0061 family)|nr:hypothetical protein [Flavobacteriaceae bacterium]MDG1911820.1 hypothetical protein [Flavobacteriaceae bacterium]